MHDGELRKNIPDATKKKGRGCPRNFFQTEFIDPKRRQMSLFNRVRFLKDQFFDLNNSE